MKRGRLGLRRFRTECPGGVSLRPADLRQCALAGEFFVAEFLVFRTRQRRHERYQVIHIAFGQGEGLDIFVEPGVFDAVALVVVIHHIPESLLGTVVEIRCGHHHVAQVRGLEGSDIGRFPGDEKAAQHRQIRLNSGVVDSREIVLFDAACRLARKRDNVMPENTDADVVKVKVREVGGVHIYGGMTAAAVPPRVEKHPAALGGGIDSIRVAGDETVEGRIKRDEGSFIGGDSA